MTDPTIQQLIQALSPEQAAEFEAALAQRQAEPQAPPTLLDALRADEFNAAGEVGVSAVPNVHELPVLVALLTRRVQQLEEHTGFDPDADPDDPASGPAPADSPPAASQVVTPASVSEGQPAPAPAAAPAPSIVPATSDGAVASAWPAPPAPEAPTAPAIAPAQPPAA